MFWHIPDWRSSRRQGWDEVAYEPAVTVTHIEPTTWRELLSRQLRYGTGAALLARRHPHRLSPLAIQPVSAIASVLLLSRKPRLAAAGVSSQAALLARRTRRLGIPGSLATRWSAASSWWELCGMGRAATTLAAPGLLLGLVSRRTRFAAFALITAPALQDHARRRPKLDPVRWTALCVADDIAYGRGSAPGSESARASP